jgi:hypothetical protein
MSDRCQIRHRGGPVSELVARRERIAFLLEHLEDVRAGVRDRGSGSEHIPLMCEPGVASPTRRSSACSRSSAPSARVSPGIRHGCFAPRRRVLMCPRCSWKTDVWASTSFHRHGRCPTSCCRSCRRRDYAPSGCDASSRKLSYAVEGRTGRLVAALRPSPCTCRTSCSARRGGVNRGDVSVLLSEATAEECSLTVSASSWLEPEEWAW